MSAFGVPALARYNGLELPIFEDNEVLRLNSQFKEAARQKQPNFVRRINLCYNGSTLLKACLEEVDMAFVEVAEACNAQVVQHQWGLYIPTSRHKYTQLPTATLPEGYHLAARVNTIIESDSVFASPEDQAQLDQRLTDTYKGNFETENLTLGDMLPRQFMVGEEAATGQPGVWLVDIDIQIV